MKTIKVIVAIGFLLVVCFSASAVYECFISLFEQMQTGSRVWFDHINPGAYGAR